MAYRIPPDEEVAKAIDNVLIRTPRMHSQRELCEAVSAELAFTDPLYRVGAERIRRIGVDRGIISLEIYYASTDRDLGPSCPVCGDILIPVRNRTLDGGIVEMSRGCRRCKYVARGTESRPARYEITRKAAIDSDSRVSMLREAQALLLRAADLMDGALRMSGIESRSGKDSRTIRRIAADPSYGGSLSNLSLDLERLEKDPVWTQPLVSPKNLYSKGDSEPR